MTTDRTVPMPPVLGRLMRGTFFLALKTPLQAVIALVSIPLVQRYIGEDLNGAYLFAWSFGFFQFLLRVRHEASAAPAAARCPTPGPAAIAPASIAPSGAG